MSKGGSQTVTQNVDPATQAYVNQMRQAALGYAGIGAPSSATSGGNAYAKFMIGPAGVSGAPANATGPAGSFVPPPNPALDAAQAQYGQYANAGSQGLAALTGGPNPFMNQYLSQLNPVFDQLRQQAMNAADDRATQLGAFGGSRNDVTRGQALGDIANTQAELNYNAFNDSQQRAMALANLGYGAQARSAFLPQQFAQGQLNLLNSGIGPYGQTQTTHTSSDPFSQLLGLGLMFVPGGPLAGLASGGASQMGWGLAGGI